MNFDPFGGKRKIHWDPSEQIIEETPPPPPSPAPRQQTIIKQTPTQAVMVQPKVKITRNRTGNGHKKQKVRDLLDTERNHFKGFFLSTNGQIENDYCTILRQSVPSHEVAIFQVTGFISHLHREVAQNRLELNDLQAYCNWMHARYAELWEQWNRPAFVNVRQMNAANRAAGRPLVSVPREQSPTVFIPAKSPKFVAFQRRGTYARTGT
ncbi:MAG: hypothetical protein IMZ61_16370 [Planctomycetes bacterium]|nr:hypothetical protein [Planctomycetota bacterium]